MALFQNKCMHHFFTYQFYIVFLYQLHSAKFPFLIMPLLDPPLMHSKMQRPRGIDSEKYVTSEQINLSVSLEVNAFN